MIQDPPFLEHYLFENPWPGCIALVVVALAIVFTQRGGLSRKMMIITSSILVAAGGLYLTAMLVMTEREELVQVMKEFARRAEEDNIESLRPMFDSNAVLTDENGKVIITAGLLFSALESTVQGHGLTRHAINDAKAEMRSKNTAQTWIRVSTKVAADGGSHPTEWLIQWRRDKNQWKVTEMRWLTYRGMSPPTNLILR